VIGAERKAANKGAVQPISRTVLRSANRVSDDPACSNKVQKTTLKTISTIAETIIWNSVLVPFIHDQIRIAGTLMRNVPNRILPMIGSDLM